MWQDENIHRAEHHLLWPGQEYRAELDVLVAGCGTWQAAKYALCHPAAHVVAIDISPASLWYTSELAKKYDLNNLQMQELPVENVSDLDQQFDLIMCTGVLHHLADPDAGFRRDVCRFQDERLSPAARAQFVHALLRRDMAEVRLFLDRLERYAAAVAQRDDDSPGLTSELAAIADDGTARDRFVAFMHATDDTTLSVRLIDLAQKLGWLSADERLAELGRVVSGRYAHPVLTAADVDFVCKLNASHALDHTRDGLGEADDVGHAAIRACLGDVAQRPRLLAALTSPGEADVQIAQVYLQYQPLADADEVRDVTSGIGRMSDAGAQVRALDALADHRVADREALENLARLFPLARTIDVQRAIAGVLIRADFEAIDTPQLVRTLREHRFRSRDGRDLIDVLIDRLGSPA